MSTTIPHLLEPYLSLPEETSLVVLSSILGASTNWLLARCLYSYLKPSAVPPSDDDEPETAVLLVSFLRDYHFFQSTLSKLSLDLDSEIRKGKFGFIDGLSGLLYLPTLPPLPPSAAHPPVSAAAAAAAAAAGSGRGAIQNDGNDLRAVQKVIEAGLTALLQQGGQQKKKKRAVLVIDQPDFLVASTAGEDNAAAMGVRDMILDLREKVHSCVVTVSADDPLIHPSSTPTPLETNHSWFVLSLLHEAGMLCALRLLDTGTAKDVSGVVRITNSQDSKREDREYLYKVGGHGGVKVFERGGQ
ncbi:hypothetical protein QBC36DRAFT_326861 [Triangularia setosa]|uniref:Elongator complex protein 6 n=1 Tax=Triangularia setosa TaxID=2587417 RepID=A0AAN7A6X2_9PEZI|nr:hypothetical protein QBC36DRAFT_326861 [Podospora setosa]